MPRTKKAPDAESAAKTETAAKAKRSPKTPAEAIKSLKIYVKPEDGAAYYVVNDGEGGKVEL